jgi:hypothetical protein
VVYYRYGGRNPLELYVFSGQLAVCNICGNLPFADALLVIHPLRGCKLMFWKLIATIIEHLRCSYIHPNRFDAEIS